MRISLLIWSSEHPSHRFVLCVLFVCLMFISCVCLFVCIVLCCFNDLLLFVCILAGRTLAPVHPPPPRPPPPVSSRPRDGRACATATLRADSSRTEILRVETPGALPVWGDSTPLKQHHDRVEPAMMQDVSTTTGRMCTLLHLNL